MRFLSRVKNAAVRIWNGRLPFCFIALSFLYIEFFGFYFLARTSSSTWDAPYPLAFGVLWSILLSSLIYLLPKKAKPVVYGILYYTMAVYVGFQTGYCILFSQMMWLSDFLYTAEGASFAGELLTYPVTWWAGITVLVFLGIFVLWKFPRNHGTSRSRIAALVLVILSAIGTALLPNAVFKMGTEHIYANTNFSRSESKQAAYENMFNPHRLYKVCGVYQTLCKDIYTHYIYPLTPGYIAAREAGRTQIESYFADRPAAGENQMTGVLADKNVILVLMESMDDWMIGEHTPTLARLMDESIQFTDFYTPAYGGVRTFNTEFCVGTGSFLNSQGGYALDYVTNNYDHSLPNLLKRHGYSSKVFHLNSPNYYSRGEFAPAMGYEDYISYSDYVTQDTIDNIPEYNLDDAALFYDANLNELFFREAQHTLNFVITYSAHLTYVYDDPLSVWGLNRYPHYRGLTGNEETDCALLKAKLVDDFFVSMLDALEQKGQLEDTVIIGITDHYTYGYKDMDSLLKVSGVQEKLLLEKTPCFIWSADLEPQRVNKVLNTADLLPTVLNLLGVESPYSYIGRDAFDETYEGLAPFSDGSWIYGDTAYDAASKKTFSVSGRQKTVTEDIQRRLHDEVQEFIRINNLILDTDYYKEQ